MALSMDVSPSPARRTACFGGSCPKWWVVRRQRSGKRRATTHSQYAPCAPGTTARPSGCLTAAPAPRYSPVVLPRRARLFSTIAVLTVAAVNAAGLWSIAASRRAAADEAGRLFRLGTETRARALEGVLTGTRSDLEFLAGSPLVTRVLAGGAGAGRPGAERAARRHRVRAPPLPARASGGHAPGRARGRAESRSSSSAAAAACPSSGSRRIPPAARARPWRRTGRAWPRWCRRWRRRSRRACSSTDREVGGPSSAADVVLRARGRHRARHGRAASPRSAISPLQASADVAVAGWTSAVALAPPLRAVARTSPTRSWSRWPRAIARRSP